MVVGGHGVLVSEDVIAAAVVADVHDEEKVVPADGRLDKALAVAGGKTGTFTFDDVAFLIKGAALRPFHEVRVDLLGQLARAGQADQPKFRHPVTRPEDVFRINLPCHS